MDDDPLLKNDAILRSSYEVMSKVDMKSVVSKLNSDNEFMQCRAAYHCYMHIHSDESHYSRMIMGDAYRTGRGCPRDLQKALVFYRDAYRAHVNRSQIRLISALWELNSMEGDKELIHILNLELPRGDKKVYYFMGMAYHFGRGIEKNEVLAKEYMGVSSKLGYDPAKVRLIEWADGNAF